MGQHKINTMNEVTSAFAAWKQVNDRIAALQLAQEQHGARPDAQLTELQSEREALEREADRLLMNAQHALLKIKTPRSSNGDSTWA